MKYFSRGRVCLIGSPKFDDVVSYREKMASIIAANEPSVIHVIHMEVPCCGGLVRFVEAAVDDAEVNLEVRRVKIGIRGEVVDQETMRFRFRA